TANRQILACVDDVLRLPEPVGLVHPPQTQLPEQPRLPDLPGDRQHTRVPHQFAVGIGLEQPGRHQALPPAERPALTARRPLTEPLAERTTRRRVRSRHNPRPPRLRRTTQQLREPWHPPPP